MKSAEEIMEILDAYDLTGSFRDAGELAGCSHHTVKHYVDRRAAGGELDQTAARLQLIDEYLPKVEEWVERSFGKVRADVAHEKLVALGYKGSERTTRRAVAKVKASYRSGRVRVHRPWVTEPGMWLQYDYGDGPVVDGVKTVLFVAWLAWSRFRVVLPLRDKTMPSVFAALDVTFRRLGGVPTYVLTDNEKTVTVEHIAGIPVRNQQLVTFAEHYSVVVHTCVPADPASKGGTEASVKISKADLVPKDTNLREEYASFAELEAACEAFCEKVNTRAHRTTKRPPIEMLAEERARLHPVPARAHTVAFGTTRMVPANTPMVMFESGQYSVPHTLLGATVWVRTHGVGEDEWVVIVHVGDDGPIEVARHRRATPGTPKIDDGHFPPQPSGPLDRQPRAKNAAESEFLDLGEGARLWLVEAAAAGTPRMRVKMTEALALAKLFDPVEVDWALGHAAVHGRFAEADLSSILDHHARQPGTGEHRASEDSSLTQGTAAWARLGQRSTADGDGEVTR
ncbi:IS21 family transposase (plasmid) [Arthrobacter sp. TES]|uniref:IS21 family transposase n=2 Tax=Actinomycetes TaxID=1760 RepID=A0A4P6KHZ3_9MICO|nr:MULTISPECIES: IS21 family transposase [Actinomycetes]AOY73569.1 transposase [Arthrobacter sp. ZXY-2]QOI65942.1 IS21 family transposase [Arthrobacter sp. TES]MCX8456827.1 IS21 family transposase [Paenarthrobacter ureafaciens]MCY0974435.1 IS21 family transposase [Paenarthrobacter ureafaciens]QBE49608.1 IS21 family transposase [Leucobacter triazinivorans]